jgi:hypothetical protein
MQVKQTATNVAIVVASFLGALVVAIYAARPFVFQVREGFNEGTPVQMLVFTFVFICIRIICHKRKLPCEAPPQEVVEFKLTHLHAKRLLIYLPMKEYNTSSRRSVRWPVLR